MRKSVFSTLILVSAAIAGPGISYGDTRDEIVELEHKRNDALVAQDWDTYDELLGEEFFHAHVMGGVLQKGPHLEHLRSGKSKVAGVKIEDLDVRLYGDVAIVTAVSHVEITHVDLADVAKLTGVALEDLEKKGREVTRHQRYLHVWIRRAGAWELVARQATYLTDETSVAR